MAQIEYQDIFTDDRLNIKSNVIDFAHLIEHEDFSTTTSSKVYSISAEFGGGKTFFCTKLYEVLKHDKIPVSMINIWTMDFYENPLIPILKKLQETYIEHHKVKVWATNTLKFIENFISWLIKQWLKYKGFNINKIVRLYKQFKPKQTNIYRSYIEYEHQLSETKKFLASWAKKLNTPVVIIIDELDRCKPDFAVKTLETLKHFFDIPGFVFILALDETQLKNSVEKLFGTTNFDGYKRKFINNSFILPAPDKVSFTNFLYEKSGLANLLKRIEDNQKDLVFKFTIKDLSLRHIQRAPTLKAEQDFNHNQTPEKIIKKYFAAYSIWFNFSLRQMEQVFDRLVLFTRNILNSNELFSPDLAVLLVCLHEFDLQIYNVIRTTTITVHASYRGLLSYIYNTSKTSNSVARDIYKDEADKMFYKLNRDIIPTLPQIRGFSTRSSTLSDIQVIYDDVDRFFVTTNQQNNPLEWIIETNDKNSGVQSIIQNNGRIAIIISSKHDAAWKEPPPDIDTASSFNLEKFRQSYFDKMDFLSSFK